VREKKHYRTAVRYRTVWRKSVYRTFVWVGGEKIIGLSAVRVLSDEAGNRYVCAPVADKNPDWGLESAF
jgi:hypothetical protein